MAKTSGGTRSNATRMSDLAKEALDYYVSGNGYNLNSSLRRGEAVYGEDDLLMRGLDEAVKQGLSKTTMLYRGVSAEAILGEEFANNYGLLKSGLVLGYNDEDVNKVVNKVNSHLKNRVIVDRGYSSASLSNTVAEGFGGSKNIVLKFKAPRGTRGVNLSKNRSVYKNNTYEKEVLLGRGMKYKVLKIYGQNGQIYADVKLL